MEVDAVLLQLVWVENASQTEQLQILFDHLVLSISCEEGNTPVQLQEHQTQSVVVYSSIVI